MLSAKDKERIQAVQQGRWMPHPYAKRILDELELVMNQPKIDGAPMGKALIGRSGAGKTTILKHFMKVATKDAESSEGQPIYLNVPSGPNLNTLLISILARIIHEPSFCPVHLIF